MGLGGIVRFVKWFSISPVARHNKWVVLPLLIVVGGAGALWATLSIINQAFVTFQHSPLLTEGHFYYAAICCVSLGLLSGIVEVMRVVGKQMILREAFKVQMALDELHSCTTDEQIKELTESLLHILDGRPATYSFGEYELLRKLEAIDPADGPSAVIPRVKEVLWELHETLLRKRQEERLKNSVILAFDRLGLFMGATSKSMKPTAYMEEWRKAPKRPLIPSPSTPMLLDME